MWLSTPLREAEGFQKCEVTFGCFSVDRNHCGSDGRLGGNEQPIAHCFRESSGLKLRRNYDGIARQHMNGFKAFSEKDRSFVADDRTVSPHQQRAPEVCGSIAVAGGADVVTHSCAIAIQE